MCGDDPGLALHGGILLIVNIPIFGELMIATYLTFLTPDELDSLLRAINPRSWLRRERKAAPVIPGRVDGPEPLPGPYATAGVPDQVPVGGE